MNQEKALAIFEGFRIRRVYDEASGAWWFSVVDIIAVLLGQPDHQAARRALEQRRRKMT